MKLPISISTGGTEYGTRSYLKKLATSISAGWNVQHNPDGTHKVFASDGSLLTDLNASALTTGTVPDGRFPATLPAASGVNLTALNATNLASGVVPAARFPAPVTVAHNGADFVSNFGVWTVASGDLTTFSYFLLGKLVIVSIVITTSTLSTGTATILTIKIPGSLVAAKAAGQPAFLDVAGTPEHGHVGVAAAGTVMNVTRLAGAAFTVSTDTTKVHFVFPFEVQ